MSSEIKLYLAVTMAREAIHHGFRAKEAAMNAAQLHGLPRSVDRIMTLAWDAEQACQRAREDLVVAQNLRNRERDREVAGMLPAPAPDTQSSDRGGVALGEFAKIIGVSASRVTKMRKAGLLVLVDPALDGKRARVDVAASKALIARSGERAFDEPNA